MALAILDEQLDEQLDETNGVRTDATWDEAEPSVFCLKLIINSSSGIPRRTKRRARARRVNVSDATADRMLEKACKAILNAAYDLCARNLQREAVDWIINNLDDLLNDGDFALCNSILRSAELGRLGDASIVTLLGVTIGAKSKLVSRPAFFHRALSVVAERRGIENSEKLLNKYL